MVNVIKYGGSIINNEFGYNQEAINYIIKLLKQHPNDKFLFIIGGGRLTRKIQNLTLPLLKDELNLGLINYSKDWLGISISRVNAEYVRTLVAKELNDVYSEILLNPEINVLPDNSRIFFAGGWKPGFSTDYVALSFAKNLNQNKVFKISDFDVVLDVKATELDKTKLSQYKKLPVLSWKKLHELVGNEWIPGFNAPLDPASVNLGIKLNKENNFKLFIAKYAELTKLLNNKDFIGSIVK